MPASKAAKKPSPRPKSRTKKATRNGTAKARKGTTKARKAPAKSRLKVADAAEGNMPVQAYLSTLPQWQKAILQDVDALIDREVPGVQKAIKWHTPVYGTDRSGWFASLSAHSKHVKVIFFQGHKLKPAIAAAKGKQMRSIDLREGDTVQGEAMASYMRQAAAIRGIVA